MARGSARYCAGRGAAGPCAVALRCAAGLGGLAVHMPLGCARAMAAAVTAARSEPRRVQMRVDAAKVSTYYIVLVHWQAVTAFAGGDWPLENTKEAAWQEFTRVWNATGMTFGSAFHCDLGCVRAQIFGPHSGRHRLKSDEVATQGQIMQM